MSILSGSTLQFKSGEVYKCDDLWQKGDLLFESENTHSRKNNIFFKLQNSIILYKEDGILNGVKDYKRFRFTPRGGILNENENVEKCVK